MSNLIRDLNWNAGSVNPSGIRPIAFFIDKTDIVGFPEIPDNPTTSSDFVNLEGDFVLKPGAFWKRFYSTSGKGKVDFENAGEKDCKMFKNKASLKFPDLSDDAVAVAKTTVNSNMVFIVFERTSGTNKSKVKAVVLGSNEYDVDLKFGGASGSKPGDEKGLSLEIEADDETPLPRYNGVVVLEDGSYDCEIDTFTPSTPAVLAATVSVTHTQGQMGGTITVNATGGTKPYIYRVGTGNFQSSNIFDGLSAGTYSVTVKDSIGTQVVVSTIVIS